MACVNSTSSLQSRFDVSQHSLSCGSKVFESLRVQFPDCYGIRNPSLNVEFHSKVYKSIQFSIISASSFILFSNNRCISKPTRERVSMMALRTPRVLYRNPDGSRERIDLWDAFYRDGVIFIAQQIDEEFSNRIIATMLYLDTEYSKGLRLFINCKGGDLTPSMSIYDTMRNLKNPVATHCFGAAINMAGFLLAAGEKGHRSAMPSSLISLESPESAARDQTDDILSETDELLRIRDYLFKELAQNTGQPVEKIHKDLSRLKSFTKAEEAIEYGIIDRVIRAARERTDAPRKDSTAGLG
ncbi:hypothetical protein OROGR_014125 [Orobanche gracilis]